MIPRARENSEVVIKFTQNYGPFSHFNVFFKKNITDPNGAAIYIYKYGAPWIPSIYPLWLLAFFYQHQPDPSWVVDFTLPWHCHDNTTGEWTDPACHESFRGLGNMIQRRLWLFQVNKELPWSESAKNTFRRDIFLFFWWSQGFSWAYNSQRDIHLSSSIQNSSLLYLYTTFKQ